MATPYKITATGLVATVITKGHIVGATLAAGAGAAATLVINDSQAGAGTDIITLAAPAGGSSIFALPGEAVDFKLGAYATLAGAGAVGHLYVQ